MNSSDRAAAIGVDNSDVDNSVRRNAFINEILELRRNP